MKENKQDKIAEMQNFVSKYKDSHNPALDMLIDTAKNSFGKNLPDGFGVVPRMSEDGTILSIDLVQKIDGGSRNDSKD